METYNTAETLLDEEPLRREMANLASLVKVSKSWGKPLRIGEINSISNSGRANVSDVFAAALWALDACFEVGRWTASLPGLPAWTACLPARLFA
jgi:hypothetical protein